LMLLSRFVAFRPGIVLIIEPINTMVPLFALY
jgi:hypothetical protein